MHHILCFDVSNNNCSVAISRDQEILSFEQELSPSMQAERLMVMVENALLNAQVSYQDIDYLGVTVGPGSFTGIRIGLASAKGILYASKIKGVAISNFETSYYRLCEQITEYDIAIILLNAYRNQVYIQEFLPDGSSKDPKLLDTSSVKDFFESQKARIVCAGNGIEAVYNEIKDIQDITILPRFSTIKASHIARLVHTKIKTGMINKTIEPLYIRLPDAIRSL